MGATLRDVAVDVGVSIKTVSRVVNNDTRVAPETERLVRESLERLGYTPNLAARSLRGGANHTIGLVVDSVADPFFSAIVGAVEDAVADDGYAVLAVSTKRDSNREAQVLSWLAERRVSGCIVVPATEKTECRILATIPFVYLDRVPPLEDVDSVLAQDFEAAYEAVSHLVKHGHTRVAFVGDEPVVSTTRNRLDGYKEALMRSGVALRDDLLRACCPQPADAFAEIKMLMSLEEPPTAVFAAGSRQASGIVSGMTDWQRRHVALISFGDLPIADALSPALSVVDHDPAALAHDAVDLLMRRMGDPEAPVRHIRRPMDLIARGSGELPPYDMRADQELSGGIG